MSEPRLGFKYLIKTKKESKVKAYFTLVVPTETMGNMEISGFKVIDGKNGLFPSLPNRAVKVPTRSVVDAAGVQTSAAGEEVKYYNTLRFENQAQYNKFITALKEDVMPLIEAQLR